MDTESKSTVLETLWNDILCCRSPLPPGAVHTPRRAWLLKHVSEASPAAPPFATEVKKRNAADACDRVMARALLAVLERENDALFPDLHSLYEGAAFHCTQHIDDLARWIVPAFMALEDGSAAGKRLAAGLTWEAAQRDPAQCVKGFFDMNKVSPRKPWKLWWRDLRSKVLATLDIKVSTELVLPDAL
jgi:hypothetical protein